MSAFEVIRMRNLGRSEYGRRDLIAIRRVAGVSIGPCEPCGAPDDGGLRCSYCKTPRFASLVGTGLTEAEFEELQK